MTRVALTGAGGFVGSHVAEHILAKTSWELVATDSFRHKGRCDRLARILAEGPRGNDWRARLTVITHDLAAPLSAGEISQVGYPVDLVIAMASQSHVERSLKDPVPFVKNNVDVILNTLELFVAVQPQMVLGMATDEVYGPVVPGMAHREWAPILPSNPYAAGKACQEAIAISYWRAFGAPVVIVKSNNPFGGMQEPRKHIPLVSHPAKRRED